MIDLSISMVYSFSVKMLKKMKQLHHILVRSQAQILCTRWCLSLFTQPFPKLESFLVYFIIAELVALEQDLSLTWTCPTAHVQLFTTGMVVHYSLPVQELLLQNWEICHGPERWWISV